MPPKQPEGEPLANTLHDSCTIYGARTGFFIAYQKAAESPIFFRTPQARPLFSGLANDLYRRCESIGNESKTEFRKEDRYGDFRVTLRSSKARASVARYMHW